MDSSQCEELLTRAAVVTEHAMHSGRDRSTALGPDPAQPHGEGLCLEEHADAPGRELLIEPPPSGSSASPRREGGSVARSRRPRRALRGPGWALGFAPWRSSLASNI